MKKIKILASALIIFIALVTCDSYAQEENLIKLNRVEIKPFIGFATLTQTPLGEFKCTENWDFRIGVKTKTELVKSVLYLKLEAGGNIGTNEGYSTFALLFERKGWWVEFGKTASVVTRFRPNPLTAASQIEYFSTAVLPGQPPVALLFGYKKEGKEILENVSVTFCVAERGYSINEKGNYVQDSLEFSTRLKWGYWSLGAYSNNGEMGLLCEFNSKPIKLFFSFREEQFAGYFSFHTIKGWGMAFDWVYNHGESGKFTQEKDFGEIIFLRELHYPLFKGFSGSCFMGVGFRNDATANLYLQIALD